MSVRLASGRFDPVLVVSLKTGFSLLEFQAEKVSELKRYSIHGNNCGMVKRKFELICGLL